MHVAPSRCAASAALLCWLGLSPAAGQFAQYTAPGPPSRPTSLREVLEQSAREARWQWGPWRVEPALGVSDLGYRKADSEPAQWTLGVTAGLRGYLGLGRSTLALYALPVLLLRESDETESSVLERFGAGWVLALGRLELELLGTRGEAFERISLESPERVERRGDTLRVNASVPLSGRLYWTAAAASSRSVHGEGEIPVATAQRLDRREESLGTGLLWKRGDSFSFQVGAVRREIRFDLGDPDRGGAVESYTAGFSWRRSKTSLSVAAERSEFRPERESGERNYVGTTYRWQVAWQPRSRFGLNLYGQVGWTFPLFRPEAVLADERRGIAVELGLTSALRLSLFAERGELSPVGVSGPTDRSRAEGARASVALGRLGLEIGYRRLELRASDGGGYRVGEWLGTFRLGAGSVAPEF